MPKPGPGPVLVVDDDDDGRALLAAWLESEGHVVITAADGAQALALLRTIATPSIVLLDVHMPGMNGWELLARLKTDARLDGVPVVIVSSTRDGHDARLAGRVFKPYDPSDLSALVGDLVAAAG